MFAKTAVSVAGEMKEFSYQSAKGTTVTKAFCPNCGSPIYGTNTGSPDRTTLTLGTIEDASDLTVEVVIFARDKPHWDQAADGAMVYETQPDWTPDTEDRTNGD